MRRPAPFERWRWRFYRRGLPFGPPCPLAPHPPPNRPVAARADRASTTFRGLAELIVSELPDRELELLRSAVPGIAPRSPPPVARSSACIQSLALGNDERMCTRKVGWKRISHSSSPIDGIHKPMRTESVNPYRDSQCRNQPAACGRQVCCGIRQSIPSSR